MAVKQYLFVAAPLTLAVLVVNAAPVVNDKEEDGQVLIVSDKEDKANRALGAGLATARPHFLKPAAPLVPAPGTMGLPKFGTGDHGTLSDAGVIGMGALESKDLSLPAVAQMETAVTDLLRKAMILGPDGLTSSVNQIKGLITNTMMPKLANAHKANQNEVNDLSSQISTCSPPSGQQFGGTVAQMKLQLYEEKSKSHHECRLSEASLATEAQSCQSEVTSLKRIRDMTCNKFQALSNDFNDEAQNRGIVSKVRAEEPRAYVKRLMGSFCDSTGSGNMLDRFDKADADCKKSKAEYATAKSGCSLAAANYDKQKTACNSLQDQMDRAACQRAVIVKDACESYAQCYTSSLTAFKAAQAAVKEEEANRQEESKALQRMLCMIAEFKETGLDETKIQACQDKVYDVSFLTLTVPAEPHMQMCTVPDRYPATAAYKKAEFAPLPALAKGKEDANECYGVSEVSTRPRAGSPGSCVCERVTLNGEYSPGSLVKCSNCLDVFKAAEKNSCPRGTKLFSPRNRRDWETLINSAPAVRDPNFIVDVTRNSNGCENCKTFAMNSDNPAQKSWVTSDNSPWWLRANAYSGTTEDYDANCFMDLMQGGDISNPDMLTYNLANCMYHSKSYYCQPKSISTTPKIGSPAGCSCPQVTLTGKFSGGVLLKCQGCLDVYRSLDQNSCPEGTKIFSPRGREDWNTFFNSASPLRSPNWIIDVTRAQDQCGGCTDNPMNFQDPTQISWVTADNSPWWLRSTAYTEAAGDYKANCYMDLWKDATNPDDVKFTYGNGCEFHSNSYYCQQRVDHD